MHCLCSMLRVKPLKSSYQHCFLYRTALPFLLKPENYDKFYSEVMKNNHAIRREWEWDWLLNVTCNNISVIYMTAHRCAGGLKKLDLGSGSQCHRHFVGFFNVPVKAPTLRLFTVILRNRPISVAFYDAHTVPLTWAFNFPTYCRGQRGRLSPKASTPLRDGLPVSRPAVVKRGPLILPSWRLTCIAPDVDVRGPLILPTQPQGN